MIVMLPECYVCWRIDNEVSFTIRLSTSNIKYFKYNLCRGPIQIVALAPIVSGGGYPPRRIAR
jgi:hypothetical protein